MNSSKRAASFSGGQEQFRDRKRRKKGENSTSPMDSLKNGCLFLHLITSIY
jgi:hypothetical protein